MAGSEPRDILLARFERLIDLPAFLGQRGFEPSEPPTPAGLALTHPRLGETLVLRKELVRGTWSYTNPREPADRGTIAAYLARHDGLSPDACLNKIIACVDPRPTDDPEVLRYRGYVLGQPTPLGPAVAAYLRAAAQEHRATKALERSGLLRASFDAWRFGEMSTESAVDRTLREPSRELWTSRHSPSDRSLVLVERPIDAMSFEQARGNGSAAYLATGGRFDGDHKERLRAVLGGVPTGMTVVLAFGRDEQGRQLADEVQLLVPGLKMERAAPALGARWNDQVRLEQRHARSLERSRGR